MIYFRKQKIMNDYTILHIFILKSLWNHPKRSFTIHELAEDFNSEPKIVFDSIQDLIKNGLVKLENSVAVYNDMSGKFILEYETWQYTKTLLADIKSTLDSIKIYP